MILAVKNLEDSLHTSVVGEFQVTDWCLLVILIAWQLPDNCLTTALLDDGSSPQPKNLKKSNVFIVNRRLCPVINWLNSLSIAFFLLCKTIFNVTVRFWMCKIWKGSNASNQNSTYTYYIFLSKICVALNRSYSLTGHFCRIEKKGWSEQIVYFHATTSNKLSN